MLPHPSVEHDTMALTSSGPLPVAGVQFCVAFGTGAAAARSARTRLAPAFVSEPGIGCAVAISRALAWSGVMSGFCWYSSARTPEVTAADCDVPVPVNSIGSPSTPPTSEWLSLASLPSARRLWMWAPGAATSGLRTPSPPFENSPIDRPFSSASAPATVITKGSMPGEVSWVVSLPSLPAIVTTAMPAFQAR